MAQDPRIESLHEWNRLARENPENAIVSSMFLALSTASQPIEAFTTWLLVGAAAVASFLLGNGDKLIPVLGQWGFRAIGIALCVSCLFGLLSKIFALRHRVALAVASAVEATFLQHLIQHEQEEAKIQNSAKSWGITLESGVRLDRILTAFLAPMPWWVRLVTERYMKKYGKNPQVGHLARVRCLILQGTLAFLQALAFLAFLAIGFVVAI